MQYTTVLSTTPLTEFISLEICSAQTFLRHLLNIFYMHSLYINYAVSATITDSPPYQRPSINIEQ